MSPPNKPTPTGTQPESSPTSEPAPTHPQDKFRRVFFESGYHWPPCPIPEKKPVDKNPSQSSSPGAEPSHTNNKLHWWRSFLKQKPVDESASQSSSVNTKSSERKSPFEPRRALKHPLSDRSSTVGPDLNKKVASQVDSARRAAAVYDYLWCF